MNEEQEIRARAVELAARTLAMLYPNDSDGLARHPAAVTDDVLSLAPRRGPSSEAGLSRLWASWLTS